MCHDMGYKIGHRHEIDRTVLYTNTKVADKHAHPRNLISAFVVRFLESIMIPLNTGRSFIILGVFVAEQAGVCFTLSHAPKISFLASRPK